MRKIFQLPTRVAGTTIGHKKESMAFPTGIPGVSIGGKKKKKNKPTADTTARARIEDALSQIQNLQLQQSQLGEAQSTGAATTQQAAAQVGQAVQAGQGTSGTILYVVGGILVLVFLIFIFRK